MKRKLLFRAAIGGAIGFATDTANAFAFSSSTTPAKHKPNCYPILSSLDISSDPFLTRSSVRARQTQLRLNTHIEPISAFISSSSLISTDIRSYFELFKFSGNVPLVSSLVLNSILFFSLRPKLMTMLTPEGFAHSLALGTMLWTTLGWRGWTVCVLYLFLGQLVTKVGFDEKESLGIAEGRGGRRGPENVWGSAFTGVLCASAAAQALKSGVPFLGLTSDVWILGYVASLATKLADTFASEIGKAYGKTTFLITTLQPVSRGTEGAVSLEGTLASIVGGFALSVYAYLAVGLITSLQGVGVATFAAFVATMIESLIGATLQEKEGLGWMSNEVVNFFNTLIGAAVAMLLGVLALGM
jgi:uncharacterized protein (TIGR00297 family)